jgi:hypothetical protein
MQLNGSGLSQPQVFRVANTGSFGFDVVVRTSVLQQARDLTPVFTMANGASDPVRLEVSPSQFHLNAGQVRSVQVRVLIRPGADQGDHLLGLQFASPAASSRQGSVQVMRSVGTQLTVTVPGPEVVDTRLTSLTATPAPVLGLHLPFNDMGVPQGLVTVHNTGTVHQDFIGKTQLHAVITGWGAGHRVVAVPPFTVQRGNTVDVPFQVTDVPRLCVCQIAVRFDDGAGHVTVVKSRLVVVPATYAVGLLLVGGGGILALRGGVRRHKRAQRAAGRHAAS